MKKLLAISMFFIGCVQAPKDGEISTDADTTKLNQDTITKAIAYSSEDKTIHTGNTTPDDLLAYAKTLIGTPYKYGSTDPAQGFDCSGFITHVFNHLNIDVPRSSIDFTNVKREVNIDEAKQGDIVLFTGTDSTIRDVGHMGIVTSNDSSVVNFIHSSTGKANGVTITPMNKYYIGRFVKVIRIFPQND